MKKIYLYSLLVFLPFILLQAQPTQWESRGIGGGGALFSPSFNPANQGELYVSCDMSQLFHSKNKGRNWTEIPFTSIQGGHDSYVSFTNNPLIRYTVDYESVNGNDHIRPMKSTDGGATWAVLSGNPYPLSPNGSVLRLFADYNNPNNLILADYGTIYFSNSGGSSFTQIHTNISSGAGNHIAGVFFDGTNIYVGTNDGLIYSTNSGSSFSTMSVSGMGSGEYMLSFAGARKGGTVRFLCLTSTSVWSGYQYGSNYNGAMKAVYTMDNANGTWVSKTTGIAIGTDFPVFTGMAQNCTDTMYLSGGSSGSRPIVLRSVNGGNWTHVFTAVNNVNIATGWAGQNGDKAWSFPEAPFGFTVDPLHANRLMLTDYSCVHLTEDYGNQWQQRYLDSNYQNPAGANTPKDKFYKSCGLENTTNWQILWTDSNVMFSAFSDINGVVSVDKGKTWKFIPNLTQNSVYRIVRHSDGYLYAATSNIHDMYQTTRIYDAQINSGKGGVWISKNNGGLFQLLHDFGHPVVWIAGDPTNANRMYAAVLHSNKVSTGGIWVTNNLNAGAASTWTKMPNPPRSNGHPYNINVLKNGDLIVSYSARKPTSGTQFTDSSGVSYYDLANSTWYDRSHANMKWYTKDVVPDPNDTSGKTWYACVFSGWGSAVPANTGGLYKTTDKGLNWTKIVNSYRVDGVTILPGKPDEVYFTTETDGLWHSSNASNPTPTFNRVNSYPFRHPMRVFPNPWRPGEIWVSSFGNGMKVGTAGSAVNTTIPNEHSFGMVMYPNPAGDEIHLISGKGGMIGNYTLTDAAGRMILRGTAVAESAVISLVNIPAGMYFINTNTGSSVFLRK
ncbi:MAG: T9SS type A sorting domain-containing protein [Bacteroidetes bacterium]|nr:T9SS type A sorting domain-containing protein [Bacteroidota bacterium]